MFNQLSTHDWLQLPWETRLKLVEVFKITRSAGTHVIGGVVKTDGYTEKDLSILNIETLKTFTGLETDNYQELFNATLIKLNPERYEETKQSTPGENVETRAEESGENEGKSEESTVSAPVEDGVLSGGSEDSAPSSVDGPTPVIQQPDDEADSGGHESSKPARSKK